MTITSEGTNCEGHDGAQPIKNRFLQKSKFLFLKTLTIMLSRLLTTSSYHNFYNTILAIPRYINNKSLEHKLLKFMMVIKFLVQYLHRSNVVNNYININFKFYCKVVAYKVET